MRRNNPLGQFCVVTRALALIIVVLVVGFGASLHAHGIVVDGAVAHTGVLVDEGQDGPHPAIGVQTASATHCGGGTVCVAALLPGPVLPSAPETGLTRFTVVNFAVPSAPAFGLLRPPQHS